MKRAHTPPSTPRPSALPGGEPSIDVVAGDPPVPITVWRTPAGDDQATIPTRLAQRLVAAYSRPGEAVIDLTDDRALTDPALRGGRRCHPGWFTDASALIIGPSTPPEPADTGRTGGATATAAGTVRHRAAEDLDPLEVAAWFGDDLTDDDLPPHDDTPPQPGAGTVRAATSLVACWPLHTGRQAVARAGAARRRRWRLGSRRSR
jgi:hypothetical protein